jgi:uncharacterized phosphatase
VTSITLIRHGQTDWNLTGRIQGVTNNPLNATGRIQAETVAAMLTTPEWARTWSRVVSSPLIRASETAEVIARVLDVPFEDQLLGLTERDYGEAEGAKVDDVRRPHPGHTFPQAEAASCVASRAFAVLEHLHEAHTGQDLIVVTHGGLLQALLNKIQGSPSISIENAAINRVEREPSGDWQLRALNNKVL